MYIAIVEITTAWKKVAQMTMHTIGSAPLLTKLKKARVANMADAKTNQATHSKVELRREMRDRSNDAAKIVAPNMDATAKCMCSSVTRILNELSRQ